MAKTKTIHRRYKALTPSVSLKYEINIDGHSVGNVPTKQTYNPTFAEFTPDYTLVPCIIFPECHIDGAAVNDQLTNVKWASLADNGTKTDILVNTPGYEVSYSGADSGLIKIKKNTPFDTTHKLLFTAEYMDARTNQIYNFREEVPIVCTSEGVALPLLEVTPCHIQYDPIDGQKDYLLTASLKVGEKMEFTGDKQNFLVQYKWYKLRNKNHEANVDDLFTELTSSDRETASSATSPSITIDASKIEDGAMYRCIAEYCSIHDSLGNEENSTVMKDVDIKRVFPSFDYQMIAPDVIDEDEETISAEASVVANGRVLDDLSKFKVQWKKNDAIIGHKKTISTPIDETATLSLLVEDPTKDSAFMNLYGARAHPTVPPKSTLQTFTDVQKRKYDAKGIDSVMDWDVRDKIGAKGVKKNNSDLYLPVDINERTFEICFTPNPNIPANNYYLSLRSNQSPSDDRFIIYNTTAPPNSRIRASIIINGNTQVFKELLGPKSHIVFSYFDNKLSVWVDGEVLIDDLKYTNALNCMLFFLRNCTTQLIRNYNYKPDNEKVKEWYNEGNISNTQIDKRFKGPFFKRELIFSDWQILSTTASLPVIKTVESDTNGFVGKFYKVIPNGNLSVSLYDIYKYQDLIIDNYYIIKFKYRSNAPIHVIYSDVVIEANTGDAQEIFFLKKAEKTGGSIPFSFLVGGLRQSEIIDGSNTVFFEFQIQSIQSANCFHEYLKDNIQPHKWFDTGTLKTDIPFIENGTRVVDIEYQEET